MFTVQVSKSLEVVKAFVWYSSLDFAESLFIEMQSKIQIPYFYGKHIQEKESKYLF